MSSTAFSDTVAAIATAPGPAAVAVLRVSGERAFEIAARVAPRLAVDSARMQRLIRLYHPDSGELLDRALVTCFPAPGSYTGEDTVEISTHGGFLVPELVLDALLAAGARQAEPGEFTRRAYVNGKLDLLQAEAVLDVIGGGSRALHGAALGQLERGLSNRLEELRSAILRSEAMLAYAIDFPDEDEPPVPPERVAVMAGEVLSQLDLLLATAPEGELLRAGALVVLAGRPNAGKSSLFNALLGIERAIVTPQPGTTRDAIEAPLSIEGYPFRLVDTAGLRKGSDEVEERGIEVARGYLREARLVLFCAEAGRELEEEELGFLVALPPQRTLLVRTQADLVPNADPPAGIDADGGRVVSARDGVGLAELRGAILREAFGSTVGEANATPLVTRERHTRALRCARAEIEGFLEAGALGVPAEAAATHLRAAAAARDELIGVITPDEVLGAVFAEFCVGK
ncbi:tRNA uridine-5-carboxymethylaminomethyl(34) synthesis GTPase MnmE [soil metagenome]